VTHNQIHKPLHISSTSAFCVAWQTDLTYFPYLLP